MHLPYRSYYWRYLQSNCYCYYTTALILWVDCSDPPTSIRSRERRPKSWSRRLRCARFYHPFPGPWLSWDLLFSALSLGSFDGLAIFFSSFANVFRGAVSVDQLCGVSWIRKVKKKPFFEIDDRARVDNNGRSPPHSVLHGRASGLPTVRARMPTKNGCVCFLTVFQIALCTSVSVKIFSLTINRDSN